MTRTVRRKPRRIGGIWTVRTVRTQNIRTFLAVEKQAGTARTARASSVTTPSRTLVYRRRLGIRCRAL
jgi:hypothetical protein